MNKGPTWTGCPNVICSSFPSVIAPQPLLSSIDMSFDLIMHTVWIWPTPMPSWRKTQVPPWKYNQLRSINVYHSASLSLLSWNSSESQSDAFPKVITAKAQDPGKEPSCLDTDACWNQSNFCRIHRWFFLRYKSLLHWIWLINAQIKRTRRGVIPLKECLRCS